MAIISDELAQMINNLSPGAQVAQIGTRLQEALAGEHPVNSVTPDEILGSIVVSVDDAKTTSREENVAGLESAIALVNSLKTTINAHYADQGGGGEEHIAADTAMASPNATDLATMITLLSEIQDSYVAHDDDAILGAAWVYHQAQGTERALASAANPTNLQTCITVANDIKAKLNLHMADATAHTAGDSAQEAQADAAYGAAILVVDANVESGDTVQWSIINSGTGTVTGVTAVASDGVITFTFSADPQNDCIISYSVYRAA